VRPTPAERYAKVGTRRCPVPPLSDERAPETTADSPCGVHSTRLIRADLPSRIVA